MADTKVYAGKEGIQELWRRIKAEIGKFTAFQKAEAAQDGTPDIALADRKTNIIYLVPVSGSPDPDHYMEWIWTAPEASDPAWVCIGDTTQDLSGYALKSEMSVEPGTGVNTDKTTITLKEGTSATVLTAHQDISGKTDKVASATNGDLAALNTSGNLTDSGIAATAAPAAEGGTSLTLVTTGEKYAWNNTKQVPASTAADENKVLTVDNTGTPQWYGPITSDIFGTQLLDSNDDPVLDENNEPVFDSAATSNLWTSFANQEFGARRAYEDQDGQNIKATYATKQELQDALGDLETILASI